VVTRLGNLPMVTTKVIESLFAADFAQLQEMYNRVNERGRNTIDASCPQCGHAFEVEVPASRDR